MKFEQFIVIFGLFTFSNAVTFLEIRDWINFKLKHAKRYKNYFEDTRRRDIYIENARKVREHNERFDRGEVTFRLALNKYSDLTHDEFVATFNGLKTSPRERRNASLFFERATDVVPDSVDWRKKGAVTDVKDQGHCGSCWSFSTTGSIEGQNFLKTGKLVSLSEQNLIDCSQSFGNNGCKGGLMDKAFNYIISNGGIDTEESYPYKAVDDICSYSDKNAGASLSHYEDLPEKDEDALKRAIAIIGPISVAIDASNPSFRHYSSGIYLEENCSSENLHHAVLAIGYDADENGQDYYIVKNSWGTTWGDGGYIKMARNKKNHCGIASMPSYPILH